MRSATLIANALLVAFGLIAIFIIIPAQTSRGFGPASAVSPAAMPTLAAAVIVLLAAANFAHAYAKSDRQRGSPFADGAWRRAAAAILILVAAVLLMAFVRTWLALTLLTVATAWLLNERRWIVLVALPLAANAFFYAAIERLLGTPLP
jgi:hypothetical protein